MNQEVNSYGGGGASSLGKVLLRGSLYGDLFRSRDMSTCGTNDADVRGGSCEFPAAGHT